MPADSTLLKQFTRGLCIPLWPTRSRHSAKQESLEMLQLFTTTIMSAVLYRSTKETFSRRLGWIVI